VFKKMLVLLDGSKLAEVVFSYAGELSGRLDLIVDFLHVCKPEDQDQMPMRKAYIEHMAEMMNEKAEAGPGQAQGHVALGYPADEILKYVEDNKIDIIMLATHGISGIRRWGLGSVADKIIHETNVPIWLVPSHLHEKILDDTFDERSILVPLDGSKLAENILPYIKVLVKQRTAETEIVLVNVINKEVVPSVTYVYPYVKPDENLAALKTDNEAYMSGLVNTLKSEGFNARYEQLVGNPAEEIVRYAAEYHPRIIAMSTHGRTGWNRFIFGSLTEYVLRRLERTPLFLVRPKQ
jgi:nucleotide-binding universal stress UspA family protein